MLLSQSKYNYVVVLLNPDMHIKHSVFYKQCPSIMDIKELIKEIELDEKFIASDLNDVRVQIFDVEHYLNIVGGDVDLSTPIWEN